MFAVERHGRRFDPYGVRCVTMRVFHAAAARVKAEFLKRWGRDMSGGPSRSFVNPCGPPDCQTLQITN